MEAAKKVLDLKETKELYDFLIGVMEDGIKHKEDDGKISSTEWLQTAMTNVPAGARALMGIDMIDDELKDLDEKEVMELAAMGVKLMKNLAMLFKGSK